MCIMHRQKIWRTNSINVCINWKEKNCTRIKVVSSKEKIIAERKIIQCMFNLLFLNSQFGLYLFLHVRICAMYMIHSWLLYIYYISSWNLITVSCSPLSTQVKKCIISKISLFALKSHFTFKMNNSAVIFPTEFTQWNSFSWWDSKEHSA